MSNKNLSLDALKAHLFDALEGVKNLSDPEASDQDKTTIEQAKSITDVAGKIIDVYKLQLEGISMAARMDNISSAGRIVSSVGLVDDDTVKQIGM